MPRIRQKAEEYAQADLMREIRKGQGACNLMNCRALSDACGVPYQTLRRRLNDPDNMTLGEMKKLIKVIKLNPLVLLIYLGYSRKEIKDLFDVNAA